MKMKRLWMILWAVLAVNAMCARSLVVQLSDSTKVYFLLDSVPVMDFTGGHVAIADKAYTYEEFDRFYISETDDPNGVESLLARAGVRMEAGMMVVSGKGEIGVYAADGRKQPVKVSRRGDTATVSLDKLPRGTYLVRVGSRTVKFNKK